MKVWEYVARYCCDCTIEGESIEKYIEEDPDRVARETYQLLVESKTTKKQLMRLLPWEIQVQIKREFIADILVQDINCFIPRVIKGKGQEQITLDDLLGTNLKKEFKPRVIRKN